MNWKERWRNFYRLIWSKIQGISWTRWGILRKSSLKVVYFQAVIWTRHLPKMERECYLVSSWCLQSVRTTAPLPTVLHALTGHRKIYDAHRQYKCISWSKTAFRQLPIQDHVHGKSVPHAFHLWRQYYNFFF